MQRKLLIKCCVISSSNVSVPDSPFTIDQASAEDVLNKEPPLTSAQPIDSSGNSNIRVSAFKLLISVREAAKKGPVLQRR